MKDLRNEHNWVVDAEQRLIKQPLPSESDPELHKQVDEQKVRKIYFLCPTISFCLWGG